MNLTKTSPNTGLVPVPEKKSFFRRRNGKEVAAKIPTFKEQADTTTGCALIAVVLIMVLLVLYVKLG